MISKYEMVYTARDGKKFFSEEECAKYEQEKYPTRRYIITFRSSLTAIYEVESYNAEEAIKEARIEFNEEYDDSQYSAPQVIDIQYDEEEEE